MPPRSQAQALTPQEPEMHLVVILPFDRPPGFVDPAPPAFWDIEKETILNTVLDRAGGVGNVDWHLLSESLETPVPVLLYRARERYARVLEGLREGGARASADVAGCRRVSEAEAGGTVVSASRRTTGVVAPTGGVKKASTLSHPRPSPALPSRTTTRTGSPSSQVRSTAPVHLPPSSDATTPLPPPPPQPRRLSTSSSDSSSSSSSSSSSLIYASAVASPPVQSVTDQLRALASLGGGAFSLPPSSSPRQAGSSSRFLPPQAGSSRQPSKSHRPPESSITSTLKQQQNEDVSPTPSSPTRAEGVGSGTSSFSDLSNASLSQSALEEAAMSAMNRAGGSRISMFSKLGGTLR